MNILDRFEGLAAIIETENGIITLSRDMLPADAKEGDVLIIDGEHIAVDINATEQRKAALSNRLNRLFRK